ncbi:MAG: hypothetical protein GEU80_03985 [Dehalococcoidia bacterium]|nr:hypothetical protein [Dehalococcoidia bacterium]
MRNRPIQEAETSMTTPDPNRPYLDPLPVLRAPERTNVLPLARLHVSRGWHPAPVHGWTLPLWYGGTYDEQRAAREDAVIFDRSHLGRFYVTGEGAEAALGRVFATDPARVPPRGVARAVACRADGTVSDIATLCHLDPGRWLVVTGPRAQVALREAVEAVARDPEAEPPPSGRSFDGLRTSGGASGLRTSGSEADDVIVRDRLTESVLLSVQGPRAAERLEAVVGQTIPGAVPPGEAHEMLLGGFRALVARTSQVGEDGYWFVLSGEVGEHFWESAVANGIVEAGLAAHDALRLEAGILEAPHDTPPPVTPPAAGLDALVHLDDLEGRPRTFTGSQALRAEAEHFREAGHGPERRLVGLHMEGRRLAKRGSRVTRPVSEGGEALGGCVAAVFSARLGVGIAAAYLPPAVPLGARVEVDTDGVAEPASVVALPFVPPPEDRGAS